MTIKVTTTVKQEVEKEITLPYIFKTWPCDTIYKVISQNEVIMVDTSDYFTCVATQNLNDTIMNYMQHERTVVITEQEYNEALTAAYKALGEKTGNPFAEALEHLKEMTYMACSGGVTVSSSAQIDAALAFLKQHEAKEEPAPAPVVDLSDLPF
jgi:hypothetical protein